jgi:hypothetical protein
MPALAGLLCVVAAVDAVFSATVSGDYQVGGPVAGDNAAPAITALAHGNLGAYASHQPLMGPVSLVLRAPATGVATALGAGHLLGYKAGALVCLLVVAAFAAWLIVRCAPSTVRSRNPWFPWLCGAVAAYALLGPVTHGAVSLGHPEEPLAAVLVTTAVLAAWRGRGLVAAVALGLAVATKEWALLGAIPVTLALADRRLRTLLVAGAIAVAFYAPGAIVNPAALGHAGHMLADKRLVNPLSIWWPLGRPLDVLGTVSKTVRMLPSGFTRERIVELLAGLCVLLSPAAWYAVRRKGVRVRDPLALLALLGLMRAVADPLPQAYYFLALLIPLAAWEVAAAGRLPLVTVLATAFVAVVPNGESHLGAGLTSVLTLLCACSLAIYLAGRTLRDPDGQPARAPAWARRHVTFSARWRSSSSPRASHMVPDSPASSKVFRPG